MPRASMPDLHKIACYWMDHSREVFPDLNAHAIGWGEPFCFRCGWLAPLKEGDSGPWNDARGWLDRAHLRDHAKGGTETPDNLVPMCKLCHRIMPAFDDREAAIEWVKAEQPSSRPEWWQCFTDYHLGHSRYKRGMESGDFANFYLRAHEAWHRACRSTADPNSPKGQIVN